MLSGRGLGITGGTLDKLEAIPGFRTDLSTAEMTRQTEQIGCVITGASPELAPADKKLYALRDVTGTVPSQPLIVASIMSKKLAENLDCLVLDVKFGRGAFMKTFDQARSLGRSLVDVGQSMGVRASALLTDMDQPLGRYSGNAVEVLESIDCLQGQGPAEVMELTLALGSELLVQAGVSRNASDALHLQQQYVQSGAAWEKFSEMVSAQGGHFPEDWHLAPATEIVSANDGFVADVNAGLLGNAIVALGGGRRVMTDRVDHGVGVEVLVKVGDAVIKGQPTMRIFHRNEILPTELQTAVTISPESVAPRTLIRERLH